MQPAGGLLYRHNLNGHYSFRFFGNYTEIKGYDSYSNNDFEKNRNLSFKSMIIEAGAQLEFNFYEFALVKDARRIITPFVFGGINYFYFNPQANNGSGWVDLQPLGTEGQGTSKYGDRKKYIRHQIAVPVGLGLKFKIKRFAFTTEWGIRKTFTDYIDDISTTYVDPSVLGGQAAQLANRSQVPSNKIIDKQRGDASNKDWYVFTGLTISFNINKEAVCPDFRSK